MGDAPLKVLGGHDNKAHHWHICLIHKYIVMFEDYSQSTFFSVKFVSPINYIPNFISVSGVIIVTV